MQILIEDNDIILIVEEPIVFKYVGKIETVPVGFRSDGASVPRFFWRILSPEIDPQTMIPSVVHDYLYAYKLRTRKDADKWYYDALRANGYPWLKAQATYWGLRAFGWSHWDDDEE